MSRHQAALIVVVAVAMALRLWGSAFGWPGRAHPDEILYMPAALRMLADGSILPGGYHNPHLFTNLCAALAASMIAGAKALGIVTEVGNAGAFVWGNPALFLLAARWLSAGMGALTVACVYWLGRRLHSPAAGLCGAALLAVNFLHVRDSHFATNDVTMVLLVVVAIMASVRHLETPSLPWAGACGAAVGLAFGAKYNGVLAVASVAVSLALSWRSGRRTLIQAAMAALVSGVAALGAFLMTNPAVIAQPSNFIGSFWWQASLADDPWPGQRQWPVPLLIAQTVWLGAGALGIAFCVAGVVICLRRRPALAAVVIATPAIYVAYFATIDLFFARFALPLMPIVAIFAGAGVAALSARLSTGLGPGPRRWALPLASALIAAEPAARAVWLDVLLTRTDTRRDVGEWLSTHAAGRRVLADASLVAVMGDTGLAQVTALQPSALRQFRAGPRDFEDVDFVAVSNAAWRAEYRGLRDWAAAHGREVFHVTPFAEGDLTTPGVDDYYAPFHRVFAWRRPGLAVKVFQIRPIATGRAPDRPSGTLSPPP